MKSQLKPNPVPRRIDTDSDDVLDPLDLLEPVYEELTKDNKPSTSNIKQKESPKYAQIKRHIPKRVKRRRYSDESEEVKVFILFIFNFITICSFLDTTNIPVA